MITTLKLATK